MGEDEAAFRAFVQERWGHLVRVAFLLTGDRSSAEDLVQSVLEKVHRRWGRITRSDAPEVYVRKAMVNLAISWRRRRRVVEVPLPDDQAGPAHDPYTGVDDRRHLVAELRRLPPRTRAVLVLRYFEDLSEAEIARTLGCSVGSVKSQASRGLARLRLHLDVPPPARTGSRGDQA